MSDPPNYTPAIEALPLKSLLKLVNNHRRDPEQLLDILMKNNPHKLTRPRMKEWMTYLAQLGEAELKTRQMTRSLSGRL